MCFKYYMLVNVCVLNVYVIFIVDIVFYFELCFEIEVNNVSILYI